MKTMIMDYADKYAFYSLNPLICISAFNLDYLHRYLVQSFRIVGASVGYMLKSPFVDPNRIAKYSFYP